jgi:hypothetical protein
MTRQEKAQLIEALLSPPSAPELCERAALAGLLLRLGFALLDQVVLPWGEPPRRSLERLESVLSFRRGDRLGPEGDCTDPADAVADRAEVILATVEGARRQLRGLSLPGQRAALRESLSSALADVPPEILCVLRTTAAQRPPREPEAPISVWRRQAAERHTARLFKLLARLAQAGVKRLAGDPPRLKQKPARSGGGRAPRSIGRRAPG